MSYEGWDQVLCRNGHQYAVTAYYPTEEDYKCPFCKASAVWYKQVDQTNGCCEEYHAVKHPHCCPTKLEIDKPRKTSTCGHCGCVKLIEHETYKIPADVGNRIEQEDRNAQANDQRRDCPVVENDPAESAG